MVVYGRLCRQYKHCILCAADQLQFATRNLILTMIQMPQADNSFDPPTRNLPGTSRLRPHNGHAPHRQKISCKPTGTYTTVPEPSCLPPNPGMAAPRS